MIHINHFIDKIAVEETKFSSNFIMTMQDARDLHSDITRVLLAVTEMTEKLINDTDIEIKLSGETW